MIQLINFIKDPMRVLGVNPRQASLILSIKK